MNNEIETTTLYHYVIKFITNDNEEHSYSKHIYFDNKHKDDVEKQLLKDINFIRDDNNYIYPLHTINKIWLEVDDKIENVKVKYIITFPCNMDYIWYSKDMIEIIENNEVE